MEALLFTIDARQCAIPLGQVSEVVRAANVQAVPGAPAMLEGVVNVRGEILPVLSLRARMGLRASAVRASDYFIVVHGARRRVILRSDTTPELTTIPDAVVAGTGSVDSALAGVIPLPEGLALLQDVEAFVALAGEEALERAVTSAPSPS